MTNSANSFTPHFVTHQSIPRTRVAYRCLDWSERRDHMAGKLPKALLAHCLQQG